MQVERALLTAFVAPLVQNEKCKMQSLSQTAFNFALCIFNFAFWRDELSEERQWQTR